MAYYGDGYGDGYGYDYGGYADYDYGAPTLYGGLDPGSYYAPRVEYAPEVIYQPQVEYIPEVYYEPEVVYSPEVVYEAEPLYQDFYYPNDYYDALSGAGYYGPWPQDYYNPRQPYYPHPPESDSSDSEDECCHKRRSCKPRCRRRFGEGDLADLLDRFERDLDTRFGNKCRSKGRDRGLVGQWQNILDKFPDKKARITEVCDSDDEDYHDRRKRAIKKKVAEAKRDRLLEAIAFNADAPVPGTTNTNPNQQVVHIDFGGGKIAQPNGALVPRPMQGPNVARAYSHTTVPVNAPRPNQPQIIYH